MLQTQANQSHREGDTGLPRATIWLFAIAAGLSVANIYYAQPLLDVMAQDFDITPSAIGSVVTLTQIGYALGLLFIVPLGDLIDRRRLVIAQTLLSAGALGLVAMAKTKVMLFVGMAATGVLAVVVQVLVAFAATLAKPSERGRTVGAVTSGVVIGILGARFVAGLIADLGGWRAVYLASAGTTLVMVGLLLRALPTRLPSARQQGYGAALLSIPLLFHRDRVILQRGLLAFSIFAAFSAFWTALVLPLSEEPFSYSHTQIGLFGLVGMTGALAASSAGRLADRGFHQRTTGLSLALLTGSWGLIALLPQSVLFLLAGVILLDLAVQAVHVNNQSIIVTRHPEATSRLVGGYMVFYSAGSALGAISSTTVYSFAGWTGVCGLGAAFSAMGLGLWATGEANKTKAPTSDPGAMA